jgi:hypothetical protein
MSFPFNNGQPIPFRIVDFGRAADSILDADVDNFEYKIPPTGVFQRSLISNSGNKVKEWIKDTSRGWDNDNRTTPIIGSLSNLPPSSEGKVLIFPAVPFAAIMETQNVMHDPKNINLFTDEQFESFPNEHTDILGNSISDRAKFLYPHNASKFHNYGSFKKNPCADPELNGGDQVILARAANSVSVGACQMYDISSARTMQNMEKIIMSEFEKVYPEMKSEPVEKLLNETAKQYFSTYSIAGTEHQKKNKIEFEKFESDTHNYSNAVELLYKERIQYDEHGRMKNSGDDRCLQLIPMLVKIKEPCNEDYHITDKYALQRAEWVEKQGGGLRQHGYKVGYKLIVPLTFNGCLISVVLPINDKEWKVFDLQIPFGSALCIRLDTYHSVLYGSPDDIRYHCLLLTTKTAYVEDRMYFRTEHPEIFSKLKCHFPRVIKQHAEDVFGLNVPADDYKRYGLRVHGPATKTDELLIQFFLKDYDQYFTNNENLCHFYGFQNMTNNDVHRELVTNKQISQLIFADEKKAYLRNNKDKEAPIELTEEETEGKTKQEIEKLRRKKKDEASKLSKQQWEDRKMKLSGLERLYFALNYRRRLERILFTDFKELFEKDAIKDGEESSRKSNWVFLTSKIGADEEQLQAEATESKKLYNHRMNLNKQTDETRKNTPIVGGNDKRSQKRSKKNPN